MAARLPEGCTRLMSVDVECVASGRGHTDRAVCWVGAVEEVKGELEVLMDCKVKPECERVQSYLTPIHGLGAADLAQGEQLAAVQERVQKLLGADVCLVGHGVASDIEWLGLKKGVHYGAAIDTAALCQVWNPKYKNYNRYSLEHLSRVVLGVQPGETHDPTSDSVNAIRLFLQFYPDGIPARAGAALIRERPKKSFAKRMDYNFEGVCLAAYFPEKCTCGQPTRK